MSSVAFYFDYKSPYSYLADSQVGTLGVSIEYRPVDVVAVMQLTNNPSRTSASPAKFRYGNVDGLRWAKRYGIGFVLNDKIRSISSELLSCGAIAAQQLGAFPKYHRAIFDAVWRDNLDVASTEGFINVITQAGIDGKAIWQLAADPKIKAKLDSSNQDAAGRGVFGTPMFVFKDELFFGNDRFDFLRERIAEQVP